MKKAVAAFAFSSLFLTATFGNPVPSHFVVRSQHVSVVPESVDPAAVFLLFRGNTQKNEFQRGDIFKMEVIIWPRGVGDDEKKSIAEVDMILKASHQNEIVLESRDGKSIVKVDLQKKSPMKAPLIYDAAVQLTTSDLALNEEQARVYGFSFMIMNLEYLHVAKDDPVHGHIWNAGHAGNLMRCKFIIAEISRS
jgi:hypothetical protein